MASCTSGCCNDAKGGGWRASFGLIGDLTCHLYFAPLDKSRSYRKRVAVSASFYSMRDMCDNIWVVLLRTKLPTYVLVQCMPSVLDLVSDAELTYHTGQYFSRGNDKA